MGGISVEQSRDLMRQADLIDRKVERQRIKSKHKEQRRKVKKRRREEQVIINNILLLLSLLRKNHRGISLLPALALNTMLVARGFSLKV